MLLTFVLVANVIIGLELSAVFSQQVDPEFEKYVQRFEEHYGRSIPAIISIVFVDDMEEAVGRCYWYSRNIEIDREYWDTHGEAGREQLIFHELGHCVLNRRHNTKRMQNCPASIMYPSLSPACYAKYRKEYIKELFDK